MPVTPQFEELTKAPYLQELIDEIRLEAKEIAASPQPELPFSLFLLFETQGTRLKFEKPYFARRTRLAILTMITLLDQTGEYLAQLEDKIWQVCLEYTWALPAHLQIGLAANQAARLSPSQIVINSMPLIWRSLPTTVYSPPGHAILWRIAFPSFWKNISRSHLQLLAKRPDKSKFVPLSPALT